MPVQNVGSDIINAYLEGVRTRHQKEQNDLEAQKLEQQKQEHLDTLKEHTREFDITQSLQKALHESQMQDHVANIQKMTAETGLTPPGATETQSVDPSQDPIAMLNKITANAPMNRQGGGNILPGQELIAPNITRNITLATGQNYSVPSQFDYAKQMAQRATILDEPAIQGKLREAKATADAKLTGQLQLENYKSDLAIKLEGLKTTSAENLAKMNSSARIQAANISAGARKYAADHQKAGDQVDSDELANTAQLVATGDTKLPSGKNGIHIASILQQQGMVPLDPTTTAKAKALGSLPLLFNDLENFANKNLSDSKGFGPFSTYLSSKIPQTDIANDMASLRVNAGPIARIFEGQTGRLTMQQINLAMDAMTSGAITKSQALQRIKSLKTKADSKLYNEVLAGVPPKQQEMIVTKMGLPYSFQGGGGGKSSNPVDDLVNKHR